MLTLLIESNAKSMIFEKVEKLSALAEKKREVETGWRGVFVRKNFLMQLRTTSGVSVSLTLLSFSSPVRFLNPRQADLLSLYRTYFTHTLSLSVFRFSSLSFAPTCAARHFALFSFYRQQSWLMQFSLPPPPSRLDHPGPKPFYFIFEYFIGRGASEKLGDSFL